MVDKQRVWESDEYYKLAHGGSLDKDHPGMKKLFEYAKDAKKILDFGCGEGTRLSLLADEGKNLYGVDLSKKAINKATQKYPGIKFFCGEINDLKVGCNFDLVCSAFVLEHTKSTEKIIFDLIRRLKKGGILILMAPNYGAPNRASPVAKYNRTLKLAKGFTQDILRLIEKRRKLDWKEVKPIEDQKYEMDLDTTIEPYLGTLIGFLSSNEMKIIETDSVWERELENAKIHQKVFRVLGERGLYPFKYWGPHLVVVAEKL